MEEDDTKGEMGGEEDENDQPLLADAAELSLNSVVGISTLKTVKLRGIIMGQEVIVLINCGASHNFILVELVAKLGIPSIGTHNFRVLMGAGLLVQGISLCNGVLLQLQDIEVKAYFLPLNLGSSDVILGIQWLETLGKMQVNWKTLTMHFHQGNMPITLQGDPSLLQLPCFPEGDVKGN